MSSLLKKMFSRIGSVFVDSFAGDVARLGAGSGVALLLAVAGVPLISRLYEPESVGVFGVFISCITALGCIACGRYDQAIPTVSDEQDVWRLARLGDTLVLIISFFILLLQAGLGVGFIGKFAGAPVAEVAWMVPPTTLFLGYCQILLARALKEGRYADIAISRIVQAAFSLAVQVACWRLRHWGLVLGAFLGLFAQWVFLRVKLGVIPRTKVRDQLQAARRYYRFPAFLLPSSLVDTITCPIPYFLAVAWLGAVFCGHFAQMYKVAAVPIICLSPAVASVFYRDASRAVSTPIISRSLLFGTWFRLSLFNGAFYLVVAYFGEWLFVMLLGKPWAVAGSMAVVMSPLLFVFSISSPTSTLMVVHGGQAWVALFSGLYAACRIFALVVAWKSGDLFLGLFTLVCMEVLLVFGYNVVQWRVARLGCWSDSGREAV